MNKEIDWHGNRTAFGLPPYSLTARDAPSPSPCGHDADDQGAWPKPFYPFVGWDERDALV